MTDDAPTSVEEDVELANLLAKLSNPARLALLRQLRSPRSLGEIRLRPEQTRDGLSPDRAMSRQAVRGHLDRLLEAGFARAREARRGAVPTEEYLVDHQRLFGLAEELRRLAELKPLAAWDAATAEMPGAATEGVPSGPRLVIVHGLSEGRTFPLKDGPGQQWVLGRRWGLTVSLDYDPFVSAEHARILRENDKWFVEDLPTSRNGTTLNWALLPKNGRAEIQHGDVVGVGKSLLLFRT